MKGAEKKQRLSGSIEQKFRELGELKRRLQDEDARRKRALAKEAKAAERKEYREARAQLRAFAKEFCLEHANRPRPRKKAASVSEAELRKLGGVKERVRRKDGPLEITQQRNMNCTITYEKRPVLKVFNDATPPLLLHHPTKAYFPRKIDDLLRCCIFLACF